MSLGEIACSGLVAATLLFRGIQCICFPQRIVKHYCSFVSEKDMPKTLRWLGIYCMVFSGYIVLFIILLLLYHQLLLTIIYYMTLMGGAVFFALWQIKLRKR